MAGLLGELFVTVKADTGEFNRGIDGAEKQTKRFSVKSIAAVAAFAVAAVAAFRRISAAVSESIELYGRQVEAESGLQAALRDTGKEADRLFDKYTTLAEEIQALTTVGDEAAIEMITLAKNMGITDDQMEDTIKGAIGLSDAFGIGTQQALRGVTNALNGNFEQLSRYIPALRTAQTEAEKLAIVQEAMAGGFEISKARAETAFGALKQYSNAVGDLKEQFGQNITEGIEPFVRALSRFARRVTESIQATRDFQNILKNLEQDGESGSASIEVLTTTLNKLREAYNQALQTPIELRLVNTVQMEREIKLLEEEIRQLDIRAALEARYGSDGREYAEQRQKAAELQAQALELLADRELAALPAQERRVIELQAEIDLWAERRAEVEQTFGRESEYYKAIQGLINNLARERNALLVVEEQAVEVGEETVEIVEEIGEAYDDAASAIQTAVYEQWRWNEESKKAAEGLTEYQEKLIQFGTIYADAVAPVFESFGEALSQAEDGWVALGQTAIKAIAQIIRAYSRLWAAQAVGFFATPGGQAAGVKMAAAAAGGFIAAGIVEGFASQIQRAALGADFTTNGPQLLMVGDNPGGRERVSVEPLSSPNVNGPDGAPLYVQINLDGQVMSKFVTKAIRNNRILVDARAVV